MISLETVREKLLEMSQNILEIKKTNISLTEENKQLTEQIEKLKMELKENNDQLKDQTALLNIQIQQQKNENDNLKKLNEQLQTGTDFTTTAKNELVVNLQKENEQLKQKLNKSVARYIKKKFPSQGSQACAYLKYQLYYLEYNDVYIIRLLSEIETHDSISVEITANMAKILEKTTRTLTFVPKNEVELKFYIPKSQTKPFLSYNEEKNTLRLLFSMKDAASIGCVLFQNITNTYDTYRPVIKYLQNTIKEWATNQGSNPVDEQNETDD